MVFNSIQNCIDIQTMKPQLFITARQTLIRQPQCTWLQGSPWSGRSPTQQTTLTCILPWRGATSRKQLSLREGRLWCTHLPTHQTTPLYVNLMSLFKRVCLSFYFTSTFSFHIIEFLVIFEPATTLPTQHFEVTTPEIENVLLDVWIDFFFGGVVKLFNDDQLICLGQSALLICAWSN